MTIEERAKMYAYSVDKNRGKRWCEAKRDYFIAATDQFELDIDKACEWLKDNLPDIEYISNCSVFRQNKNQFIMSFTKAMKGE